MRAYLHSFSRHTASQKCEVAQNSEKIRTCSSSRSSKVHDFGTNRKRICDVQLKPVHTVAEKCDCCPIRRLSPLSCRYLRQSHLSAIVSLFCDSVDRALVINRNFGPILHRFSDTRHTATNWLKIAYFSYPLSHSAPPLPMFPFEFRGEVHEETRVMGLLCGENYTILTSSVFDWSTRVTDGQRSDST